MFDVQPAIKPVVALLFPLDYNVVHDEMPPCAERSTRPNVLFVVTDDVEFSDEGCYGGTIEASSIGHLARGGLRFTQHYSAGLCWPCRAAILTGDYPH